MDLVGAVEVAVVVDDAGDASALLRLAAIAGVVGRRAAAVDGPRWWRAAGAVVVDDVSAAVLAAARLPRRDHVLVVTTTSEVSETTWRDALMLGADELVPLADEARVAEWLAGRGEPSTTGRLVCCMSARGGAGASTLAAAIGLAAAADRDVLLLDGDVHGGGIDYLLGVESVSGIRWPDVSEASGLLPAEAMADALPAVGRLRVLAARPGPRQLGHPALEAVVDAGLRGHRLVVADPGRDGPVSRVLTTYADTTLLVVPCEVRAAVAAAALARDVGSRCSDVRLVVRPGRGDLRPDDVATAVGAPVAAVWPWERRLDAAVEAGTFCRGWRRSRVGALAATLLTDLGG